MSNAEAIKRNTTPPESEQTSGEAAGQSEASDGHLSSGKDPKFLCGVGLSVYQTSGCPNSNWSEFETSNYFDSRIQLRFSAGDLSALDPVTNSEKLQTVCEADWEVGPPHIVTGEVLGEGNGFFWRTWKDDIKRAAELGCNSLRISIEWALIEPKRGTYDHWAVQRYHDIFKEIIAQGMEPNVTLHWFVHPAWFEHIGAFLKEQNIPIFVDWAKFAFSEFRAYSKLWVTFNEPAVSSLCGFIAGNHPPGKFLQYRKAGTWLCNMLRAHADTYKAIRALPGGKQVEIGLVHNVFWTEPKYKGPFAAYIRGAVAFGNLTWGNETVMNFLKKGWFHYWVPFRRHVKYQYPDGKPGCDFFGLNHYSRGVVNALLVPDKKGPGKIADMGYQIYPPSIYRAVAYASELGVPIYVTENGIPSKKDDDSRREWIDGYLTELEEAVKDGFDVRGYMYWTLIDNYEWNFAFELKFGLYSYDDDEAKTRHKRKGAEALTRWYKDMPERVGKLLAERRERGTPPVPASKRKGLCDKREAEFLRGLGLDHDKITKMMPNDYDPVVAGTRQGQEVQ